ncbi:MAG: cytochrome c peroxidase [Saprospiraceae bacterium]|nr:cytochrome c peroxidase [Saprospiraceae bacterium]
MKKNIFIALGFAAAAGIVVSCQPDNSSLTYEADSLKLPATTLNYKLPSKGEANGIAFPEKAANPITNDVATLGRVLFYDKKLSLNNQVACASCHHQANAFADNVALSTGFNGQKTTRNASTITNAILEKGLFWDMRSPNLEDLATRPVRNHVEMGIEDMDKLAVKLSKISYYAPLFQKAFGNADINGERIAKSVAQFLGSMVTYNSKFDQGKNNNFVNFNAEERLGMDLFMRQLHCNNCHGGDNLNTALDGERIGNIGLNTVYTDNGIGTATGSRLKNGFFKIPSLRNVALTAPYMHDGRFESLDKVINHYDNGIANHENLFPALRTFTWPGNGGGATSGGTHGWGNNTSTATNVTPLQLTTKDKTALLAFLKTLTDENLLKDERFSSPFAQ